MAEGVGGDTLVNPRSAHRVVQGLLKLALVKMVAAVFSRVGDQHQGWLREEPLVEELPGCLGELPFQRVVKKHAMVPGGQIRLVLSRHRLDLGPERGKQGLRQGERPVLFPFPVHGEKAGVEVEVADPELQPLEEPQAAAEKESHHEPVGRVKLFQDGVDLGPGKHHRHVEGLFGARHSAQFAELALQGVPVEKQQGVEGLVLSGYGDVTVYGEVCQIIFHILR